MPETFYADGIRFKVSTDDHDERNLYGRGDPQSDERAREHAPAGVINLLAGAAISFVRIDYNVSSIRNSV